MQLLSDNELCVLRQQWQQQQHAFAQPAATEAALAVLVWMLLRNS